MNPLWIEPDKKLSLHDVMDIMRDHYEGTEYDMTKGIDAGPFGSPLRCRDLTWELDLGNLGTLSARSLNRLFSL